MHISKLYPKIPSILLLFICMYGFASHPFKDLETAAFNACIETDNIAEEGSFSTGYNATFETLSDGTSVKITFELLDTDKTGVVAFLWKQNPFTETTMTSIGDNLFSETITGLTDGETITYACKFAFAGGLAVTKYIDYEVGESCEADPSKDATLSDIKIDDISITNFAPDVEEYTVEYTSETTAVPTVTVTTTQSGANAEVSPANSLPGTTTILVTAENGTSTKTYSIGFQEEYYLVWSDEFDANGEVNSENWHHQTFPPFGGSWANGEIQHYTDRTDNSVVENGVLKIIGKKETGYAQDGSTKDYTSARLNSKYAFTYGRVDINAKMPPEGGTWPALWLLGKNLSEEGAYWQTQGFGTTNWPVCGEIDIMEQFTDKNHIAGAIHTPISNGGTENTGGIDANTSTTNFHVYSIIWNQDEIQFLFDDEEYYTYNPTTKYGGKNTNSSSNEMNWPFDEPQYLILNVALGGLVGDPGPNFIDAIMEVDYVRVYQPKSSVLSIIDFSFGVDENSAIGTPVGTVAASYAGSGILTYSIIAGNDDGIFQIDGSTGMISVADGSKLDFETRSSYSLSIEVTDGVLSEIGTVNVIVGDLNEDVLSIDNESIEAYIVYPNPSQDLLKVEFVYEIQEIDLQVFDMNGKQHQVEYQDELKSLNLDISNLTSGVYFIQIHNASKQAVSTLRFIKI